ncbi:MAG TPA: wax ester/triacylglycerol synthase domain-containing protein, partial [Acidimicrobiia bacterium]|nr:wax ester/triacylglycerol synthase domain-containing protein [Acidimicrobiia bacterium]
MAEARFEHHMSDEDALMWNIEKDPILRSTILAVAEFDRPPDWAALRTRIDRGTRVIPRLRQRVLSPPLRIGPPRWTVDPSFDLDFHLRRVRLPAPGTERVLLDVLQPIASAAFDRARPLWEFTLLEGLVREDGTEGAALAMKVHHSVTDGVGGMALLTELVDFERFAPPPDDTNVPAAPAPEAFDSLALIRDSLGHTTRRFLGIARRVPATVLTTTVVAVRHPAAAGVQLAQTARSVARILAPATAPMSPVMRDRGMGRQLAKFTISIDDVRRAGKSVDGSINDVFLAAVTGGLQRYHAHHGTAPP